MKRINIRLPDNLLAAIEAESLTTNLDISKVVRTILCGHYGVVDTTTLDKKKNPELPLKP